jgi:hypothetical protein
MGTPVRAIGVAAAVAKITGQRFFRAEGERFAEYI